MKTKQHILQVIVILFLVLLALLLVSQTYGYWASSVSAANDTRQGSINIGEWSTLTPEEEAINDFEDFLALLNDQGSAYYDPDAVAIYNETQVVDGATVTFESILLEGHEWDILGTGEIPVNGKAPRIGFVQLVDRSQDVSNNYIHPILPPAPTDPVPYPEYSYFSVNDVYNNLGDDIYSIRLNYEVQMTTSTALSNVTNISFYAYRGLHSDQDANPFGRLDEFILATNRAFTVSFSTDNVNFITLGSATPGFGTSLSANFNYYSYDIPTQYQSTPIYIRIYYNGATIKNGGTVDYSRLVIDELHISQNN